MTQSGIDMDNMPEEMKRRVREKMYEEDVLPDEEAILAEDEDRKRKAKFITVIEAFASNLTKKRNIAVTARASCGIEQIWREDEMAFEGLDETAIRNRMIDYATQDAYARQAYKGPKRSKVIINIVRPKCETAEGRFSDIQLPTDGKNWGLLVTPKPELMDAMKDDRPAVMKETKEPITGPDGQPVKIKDVAKSDKEIAEDKVKKMEAQINDQLTECGFNGECRKVIQSAVRLGTGILKGPMVVKDIKKSWKSESDGETTVRVLEAIEDQAPISRAIDPWDVYPDPECRDDIKRAAYIWERRMITPRELRELAGVEGYFTDQINEVLREEPVKLNVATDKQNEFLVRYNVGTKGSSYELWEYNGDVDREDMEALGVPCDSDFPSISACVVMVNDKPIKVTLNPLDTGDLPYDFFVWTKRSGIPWGIGVARELMWPQRVLVAAWRAMMDNAGDSAGANLVIGSGVEPMDGKWEITGKKLWKSNDEQIPIDKQFGQFQIQNNQKELQAIIEMALRFADMESQLPMLFNGERGELPKTLGATNVLVDSANVALRSRVKLWDDQITRPHITRYYDWNMQYNEDDSIKGDYKVDARGTSVLLEKEQEWQSVKEILEIRADKELSIMIDWKKALKKFFFARNVDILLPDDKLAEKEEEMKNQPPPPDPALQVAQARTQGELQKVQMVQQGDMTELQFKAEQARLDREQEIQIKLMERDMKAMELSQASGVALDKIKAELTITAQKLNTQVAMARDKSLKPSPQLTEPVVEPAPRAKPGYAFTQ